MLSAAGLFFVIAGAASIVAIPLTVWAARRSQKRKLLVYRPYMSRLPLLSERSLRDYKLSVVFQPEGEAEERIPAGYVHFVGFANLGREPIWRAEIAPANPLRLEVKGARVLDVALEAVHRPVSNIRVDPELVVDDVLTSAGIDFDFLDFKDGGLIRILTTERPTAVALNGDIVGMPTGIVNAQDSQPGSLLSKIGTGLVIALFVIALGTTPVVVRLGSGSWSDSWILVLPFVAILLPTLIAVLVNVTVWPKGPQLPHELLPRFRHIPPPMYFDEIYMRGGVTFEIDRPVSGDRGALPAHTHTLKDRE